MASKWTPDDVEKLIANYNQLSNIELLSILPGKSAIGIYKKAYRLGLRKSKEIEFINRSDANRRENAYNWNGGKRKTAKGYLQILAPEHPRADSGGYVMEHIFVFEKETGVSVPPNCCIHHLNGDKSDNRIENLCLMSRGAHTVLHHAGTKQSTETRKKISEKRRKKQCSIT